MSADISKIKDRIRKLLNLAADDGAAEGEIDNALRAARRLMLDHQLSEDDVTQPEEDWRTPDEIAADTEYGTAKSWGDAASAPTWKGTLASAVAKFVGTVQVYRDNTQQCRLPSGIVRFDGRSVTGWVFYGPADDCQFAVELHAELMLTCAASAKLKYGGGLVSGAGRDYCDGFAAGLYEKMQDAEKAIEHERAVNLVAPASDQKACTALAVVRATDIIEAKRDYAKDWLKKEKGISLGKASRRGRSIRDRGAYSAGRSDGRSQSMTRTHTRKICG